MKFPAPSEDQGRIMWTAATSLAVAVILFLAALIFVGLGWVAKQLSSVLLPLAAAGVIAYLLDPVVDFAQRWTLPFFRRRLSRPWAIILVFFLAVFFLAGVAASVVPQLLKDTSSLVSKIQEYPEKLSEKIKNWIDEPPIPLKEVPAWENLKDTVSKILEFLSSFFPAEKETSEIIGPPSREDIAAENKTQERAPPIFIRKLEDSDEESIAKPNIAFDKIPFIGDIDGKRIFSLLGDIREWSQKQLGKIPALAGLFIGIALMPVYVFYFLAEKKGISDSWTDYLPIRESKMKEEIVFILRSINDSLIVFFRSQVLVAMCVGVLLMIGFSLIQLPYAVLLGFLAGILGIVPYLGVMLSIAPALIIAFIEPKFGMMQPVLTLGVFVLVQTLEGMVISPKIIGNRVGMHPLTVIISIMVGTTLLGNITGGLLAIPLTAALRTLMFRYVWRRREWTADAAKPISKAEKDLPASDTSPPSDPDS